MPGTTTIRFFPNRSARCRLCVVLVALVLLAACRQKKVSRTIEPAFYYWKTNLAISPFEQGRMDSLHIKTIYLRFFDIDWDENSRSPVPVAKLTVTGNPVGNHTAIIPTVFITNECIRRIGDSQITGLANRIYTLTQDMLNSYGFNQVSEIQFDCDWTAATKETYFELLRKTKALWKNTAIPLSATIRLHQVKFLTRTGVPPVDKGLLMCYNMGNLTDPSTRNSILETAELKKYTGNLSTYPLPLDLALPLFDWKVLFRNNQYKGLMHDLPDSLLTAPLAKRTSNRFAILTDTVIGGYALQKGDWLRSEQSDIAGILAAAKVISEQWQNTRPRVSLYHLDSVILSKYSLHELESIFLNLR